MCRWPHHQFCDQQVLLLVDFAYNDRFAWDNPAGSGTGDAAAAAAPDDTNATAQQQREQLPPAVTSRLGSGYSSSLPVHYINSTFVCQQPSAACADAPSNGTRSACLLAAYARLDPDAAAGAGEGAAVGAPGRKYGVSVVLPAVLASVGECFDLRPPHTAAVFSCHQHASVRRNLAHLKLAAQQLLCQCHKTGGVCSCLHPKHSLHVYTKEALRRLQVIPGAVCLCCGAASASCCRRCAAAGCFSRLPVGRQEKATHPPESQG